MLAVITPLDKTYLFIYVNYRAACLFSERILGSIECKFRGTFRFLRERCVLSIYIHITQINIELHDVIAIVIIIVWLRCARCLGRLGRIVSLEVGESYGCKTNSSRIIWGGRSS